METHIDPEKVSELVQRELLKYNVRHGLSLAHMQRTCSRCMLDIMGGQGYTVVCNEANNLKEELAAASTRIDFSFDPGRGDRHHQFALLVYTDGTISEADTDADEQQSVVRRITHRAKGGLHFEALAGGGFIASIVKSGELEPICESEHKEVDYTIFRVVTPEGVQCTESCGWSSTGSEVKSGQFCPGCGSGKVRAQEGLHIACFRMPGNWTHPNMGAISLLPLSPRHEIPHEWGTTWSSNEHGTKLTLRVPDGATVEIVSGESIVHETAPIQIVADGSEAGDADAKSAPVAAVCPHCNWNGEYSLDDACPECGAILIAQQSSGLSAKRGEKKKAEEEDDEKMYLICKPCEGEPILGNSGDSCGKCGEPMELDDSPVTLEEVPGTTFSAEKGDLAGNLVTNMAKADRARGLDPATGEPLEAPCSETVEQVAEADEPSTGTVASILEGLNAAGIVSSLPVSVATERIAAVMSETAPAQCGWEAKQDNGRGPIRSIVLTGGPGSETVTLVVSGEGVELTTPVNEGEEN